MRAVLAAALLALGACTAPDYTPVRDWARTASLAADDPMGQAVAPADRADGILAMQDALATYLLALGRMADDGVLPYLENPFVDLAARAGRADAKGGEAVMAVGTTLRRASRSNWQAPYLRDSIATFDPAVQDLVDALARAIEAGPAPSDPVAASTRADYVTLVRRVGEGHALLKARASRITREDVVQMVRAQEDGLRRAILALPRPGGVGASVPR